MPPGPNPLKLEFLEGWDRHRAAALRKETMKFPPQASKTPAEVQSKIDAIVHFPLATPHYPRGLTYIYANLADHRRGWLIENVVIPQLERAFGAPAPGTQMRVHDMAAALCGLEAIIQLDFYRIPTTLKETFNTYGIQFWTVVQQAVEEGRVKRSSQTEAFAQIGVDLAEVPFSLAFWRCRHALRLLSSGDRDPTASNGTRLYSLINQRLTIPTKTDLRKAARTDDGRAMIADAISRWSGQLPTDQFMFVMQLVPMHILFAQPFRGSADHMVGSFPVQDHYLSLQRLSQAAGRKQWNWLRNRDDFERRMAFRYMIGVDKAILKHLIRLARTPIRILPYEVILVVYGYIYGPHSFPSCFFSRFFTPTKGTCPDH